MDDFSPEGGVTLRNAGERIELAPRFMVSEEHIGEIVDRVASTILAAA